MTTNQNTTTTTNTESKPRRRRRRAAHAIVRITEAGQHTACGEFIATRNVHPVDVDATGTPYETEFYECPQCACMKRLEKDMRGAWPRFTIPADMALDMADRWDVKE